MNSTNHTLHYKLDLIRAEDSIYYMITSSVILLFFYLLIIVAYTDRFLSKASYNIAIGAWIVWMMNTLVFYILTIDINKSEGIDNKKNQSEIINGSLMIIQLCIFIMTLVFHKMDEVAMGKVRFGNYKKVKPAEPEEENLNNI